MNNLYTPLKAKVKKVAPETRDVRTLQLALEGDFSFIPGQFIELSVPRVGEATFCISSAPSDAGTIECSVKRVGTVTEAIHMLEEGDVVGLRGPYGNGFPMQLLAGKDLLFIGGGIGLAPLRSLVRAVLAERAKYGKAALLYGARTPEDMVYKDELRAWKERDDFAVTLTVDPPGARPDWKEKVGFVPAVLKEMSPAAGDAIAVTCGPPVMIRHTLTALAQLGFPPERVIASLELKMKCGVGQCGRCNVGPLYVCKDGPVFTQAQIKNFMEDIL